MSYEGGIFMGKKIAERNHNVQIGDIFVESFTDECGHTTEFFQVLRLRGKTLVEISAIKSEFFVDETCDKARWQCKTKPKKDCFYDKTKFEVLRAYMEDNGSFLRTIAHKDEDGYIRTNSYNYLFPYNPKKRSYCISGYTGRYIIEKYNLLPEAEV